MEFWVLFPLIKSLCHRTFKIYCHSALRQEGNSSFIPKLSFFSAIWSKKKHTHTHTKYKKKKSFSFVSFLMIQWWYRLIWLNVSVGSPDFSLHQTQLTITNKPINWAGLQYSLHISGRPTFEPQIHKVLYRWKFLN